MGIIRIINLILKTIKFLTDNVDIDNDDNSDKYAELADQKIKEEEYEDALEYINMAIQENPNVSEYYERRSTIFYDLSIYDNALEDINIALSLEPYNCYYLYCRALIEYFSEDYQNAIDDCKYIIKLKRHKDVDSYQELIKNCLEKIELAESKDLFYLAAAKAENKDYQEALKDCNSAIELCSNMPTYYSLRALILDNLGKYQAAMEDYQSALALELYYSEGEKEEDTIKFIEDCINECKEKIQMTVEPSNFEEAISCFELAKKCFMDEDIEGFFDNCEKAIKLDPTTHFYSERAEVYELIKDYDNAIKDYTNAITIYKDENKDYNLEDNYLCFDYLYYSSRARVKEKIGDYQGAIDDYEIAEKSDKDINYQYEINECVNSIKNNKKESLNLNNEPDLEIKLIKYNPNYYIKRAEENSLIDNFDAAISDYTMAINLDSYNEDYYIDRAEVKEKIGDYQGAIDDYNKANITCKDEHFSYYEERAWLKEKISNYQGAIDDFKMSLHYIEDEYKKEYIPEKEKQLNEEIDKCTKQLKLNSKKQIQSQNKDETKIIVDQSFLDDIQIQKQNIIREYYANKCISKENSTKKNMNNSTIHNPNIQTQEANYIIHSDEKVLSEDYDGAIKDLNFAIKLNGKNSLYYQKRALIYEKIKDYNSANNDYTLAIKYSKNKDKSNAYISRAKFKERIGDATGAKKDYAIADDYTKD